MEHGSSEIIHHTLVNIAGMTVHMDSIILTWLAAAIVFVAVKVAARNPQMVPSGWQNAMEAVFEFILSQLDKSIGPKGKIIRPYILTIFLWLFVANNLGMIPFMTSPTNDVNVTAGMAVMVILSVHFIGIMLRGPKYLKHFIEPMPFFLPLNLVEDVSRSTTLAFRLFGNILAGEILLHVLNLLSPYVIPSVWIGFSLFVGLLQATIFTILTMSYLSNAFKEGH